MAILYTLSDFINTNSKINDSPPSYYYEGTCPQTGELLRLPRTALAEEVAHGLMRYLVNNEKYSREGKMYGILLVEMPDGEQKILKAFSGLLNGESVVEGWVPPIPGREQVAFDEARTLIELENIKQELITLSQIPSRQQYEKLFREFAARLQEISDRHQASKQKRQVKRQILSETLTGETLNIALEELDTESRLEGIERKLLKRQRAEILQPLKLIIDAADNQMRELKQQRKELSSKLQAQMHAAYSLMNFLGQSQSLQKLMPSGLPTGTGDCCAIKLLHYAATHNLKPLAMAEFWWGASAINQDKIPGEFYGACAERCQPIMGFMLCGLTPNSPLFPIPHSPLPIIYEDKWLIAVNKPAGLLSVPGRYQNTQDSVLSRLRNLLPDGDSLTAVHRLDQETSGILLIARDIQTYRQLSQQFELHKVHKIYEALLDGILATDEGIIELPLWGNPEKRPYQEVNFQYGKPSVTRYRVILRESNYTRIEFIPQTGRTHQLRVHASDVRGLGIPILGDKLYGSNVAVNRLHLHARELLLEHPKSLERFYLQLPTPF